MNRRETLVVAGLITVCLLNGSIQAEFVGGVETFTGTVKDTSTWHEILLNPGPTQITQDDALFMTNSTEYCTNTLTVGVGQTVSVEVPMMTGMGSYAGIGLSLSEHNQSTAFNACDVLRMSCVYNSSPNYNWSVIAQHELESGGTLNGFFGTVLTPGGSNGKLTLEVERVSLNEATYRAYQEGGFSGSRSLTLSGVNDQLYIRLESTGTLVSTFDNVTIVPEPCSLSLLALGGAAFLKRGKK